MKTQIVLPLLAFVAAAFGAFPVPTIDVRLMVPATQDTTVTEGDAVQVGTTGMDGGRGIVEHWIEQKNPGGNWSKITGMLVENPKLDNKFQYVQCRTVGEFQLRAAIRSTSDAAGGVIQYSSEIKVTVAAKINKQTAAQAYSATLGPTYPELHPNDPDTRPRLFSRVSKPSVGMGLRVNPYEIAGAAGPRADSDYWSSSGQVAYKPDNSIPNDPGLSRIQTGAYYSHCYALAPRVDMSSAQYGIEPFTTGYWFDGVNTQLKNPICAVRNAAMISNEELVVYENGFLGIAGTQTGRGGVVGLDWPLKGLQLPADKVPSAIALSTSNEFAFITVHDAKTGKGQIAVIACEGKLLAFHTWRWLGLPNQGSWSDFVLLGFVDLPFANPSAIAAASNGLWRGPSATNNRVLGQIDITDAGTRWGLRQGDLGWAGIVATGGYAIVASKTEGKVAVVDLSPLFKFFRNAWLSDTQQPITIAARAAGTWPSTMTTENTPTVVWQMDVAKPTCVLAGQFTDRWSPDIHKAYFGTEDGKIRIVDTSSVMNRWDFESGGIIRVIGSVQVGENPVSMCFARFAPANLPLLPAGKLSDPLNNVVHVACRGSRDIRSFVSYQGQAQEYQRIADLRIIDPVCVSVSDRFNVLTIADYNGKQVVSVRIGVVNDRVDEWGKVGEAFGCGSTGTDAFEFAGALPVAGYPFHVASSNVN